MSSEVGFQGRWLSVVLGLGGQMPAFRTHPTLGRIEAYGSLGDLERSKAAEAKRDRKRERRLALASRA